MWKRLLISGLVALGASPFVTMFMADRAIDQDDVPLMVLATLTTIFFIVFSLLSRLGGGGTQDGGSSGWWDSDGGDFGDGGDGGD